ncbi:protein of unknown function [Pseudomonas sp. JV551A1]|nr:protein of unknown function [Pseudomonas sp. JV551A1]
MWREGEGKQHAAATLEHRIARPRTTQGLEGRLAGVWQGLGTAHCFGYYAGGWRKGGL